MANGEQRSFGASEELETEARVVNVGYDIARELGLSSEAALDLATRPEVLAPALKMPGGLDAMSAEMIALVLEQPEIGDLPIRSRNPEKPRAPLPPPTVRPPWLDEPLEAFKPN